MKTLRLTNPHSVLEALRQRPHEVLEVHANSKSSNEGWSRVIEAAQEQGIPVIEPLAHAPRRHKGGHEGGRAGSTYAVVKELAGVDLPTLFACNDARGLWLALDRIQDPHNLGAIFRTAAFFGVRGIVLTQDRSAPLSETAYDVASGGVEHVPFTLQTNLARAMEVAKNSDLWVLGSSERASDSASSIDTDRKWLLVLGNEEKGLRRLTLEKCDMVCQIPPLGHIHSLNVSVATGVLLSTLTR